MSETLLAVLLVTSSAKGSNVAFHWPPYPSTQPRLARPKPRCDKKVSLYDHVWVSATSFDIEAAEEAEPSLYDDPVLNDWDYEWKRPNPYKERARSHSVTETSPRSHPSSRRASPSRDSGFDRSTQRISDTDDLAYEQLLGFPAEFLASILSPKDSMCHQKFELTIDDLAFVGHPVCADSNGGWTFKKSDRRGRGSRSGAPEERTESPISPDVATPVLATSSSPPHTFHLVFVIDLPDPSSSASGNLFKYFHVIYEQLAFTVTAVLFQEQVLHRFVDAECESLYRLREAAFSRNAPFSEYVAEALDGSSLARALKALYEAVKSNSIARLVINEVGVEVQLPPKLDHLLHSEEEHPDFVEHPDPDTVSWGPELSFGWNLPSLAPWKSLLLYDMDEEHNDLKLNLSRPGLSSEDQVLAEGLIQFLDTVSIFDSLAVVAHSLDWSLERQVYPTVRWLVYHRRAKIVDTVHSGLRTVLALSSKLEQSLPELTAEFDSTFGHHSSIPTLPKLLASISNPSPSPVMPTSPSSVPSHTRTDYTGAPSLQPQASTSTAMTGINSGLSAPTLDFFSAAVRSKDLIPIYRDVVVWLLRRGLVLTLHVHVRIVATPSIKAHVRARRERAAKRRFDQRFVERGRREGRRGSAGAGGALRSGLLARADSHRRFSNRSVGGVAEGGLTRSLRGFRDVFVEEKLRMTRGQDEHRPLSPEFSRSGSRDVRGNGEEEAVEDEDDNEDDDDGDEDTWDEDRTDDDSLSSIIPEPGQATPLQRKWIAAMSEGKDKETAKRFKLINQYFDGKRTDDEIMHRSDMTRRQLREVLHQYEEFLLTSLHPA